PPHLLQHLALTRTPFTRASNLFNTTLPQQSITMNDFASEQELGLATSHDHYTRRRPAAISGLNAAHSCLLLVFALLLSLLSLSAGFFFWVGDHTSDLLSQSPLRPRAPDQLRPWVLPVVSIGAVFFVALVFIVGVIVITSRNARRRAREAREAADERIRQRNANRALQQEQEQQQPPENNDVHLPA
ncbi:MAG: hypothetical protein Q9183_007384, partial [Haloplaca sp. 2 TL-2023]